MTTTVAIIRRRSLLLSGVASSSIVALPKRPGLRKARAVNATFPPVFTAAPSITTDGTPAVGETITLVDGTVTNGTITDSELLRDGVPIAGFTGPTYVLTSEDDGATITPRQTATGVGGTTVQSTGIGFTLAARLTINSHHFGDSITEGNAGGSDPTWVDRLDAFMDGTHTNDGIGGQTSTQIADRLVAQNSTELAKLHTYKGGTNNPTAFTTILADAARVDAAVTGPLLIIGPIGSGNMLGTIGRLNRVSESLRETYGNNFLDIQHVFRRQGPFGSDLTAVRAGTLPPALMADATHPSNTTAAPIMAEEIAAAMIAMSGGKPFVHDDLVTWSSAASTSSVIHTARKLGTVTTWAYANNPSDNLFSVNSSGQILRGSGTTYPASGIATIELRGTNASGSHTGRLLMAREAETDQPIYGVRVTGNGSMLTRMTVDSETEPFMANGTELSVVMLVKFPGTVTASAALTATHNTVINSGTAGQMRLIPRDTTGASMGTASITSPAVTDKDEWHWIMLSFDTANSLAKAVSVSPTDGVQSVSTFAGSLTTGTMGLSRINGLFTNNSGNSAPWAGDLKMLWIADTYIDFTSSTERNRFFNSTTLEPVTMAADGVVNSISPAIYLRGRCGDWLKGRNFAPSAPRMFAPFPIDAENAVFLEAAEIPVAPEITASSITGSATDGQVLTANATVTGTPTPTLAYQWQKNGANISGQTAQTITLNAATMSLADGDTISCEIVATNSEGTDSAEPSVTYSAGSATTPTWVAAGTAGQSSGTSINIAVPSGAEAGDLLLVYGLTASASSYDTPAGWTDARTASGHVIRVLPSWDGTTSSYTFSDASATQQSIGIMVFRDAVFDAASTASSLAANPTTNTLTVAEDNSLIVLVVGALATGVTYFTPSGFTSRASTNANRTLQMFTRDSLAASGPLSGVTVTRDLGSASSRAFLVSLKPA